MKIKNPIYQFSIILFLFSLYLLFFILGPWGIFTVFYLFLTYTILLVSSLYLKKTKAKNRQLKEYFLIISYIVIHGLSYLSWSVGTDLYFDNNKEPFVGKNQDFIIVFGIDGAKKLTDNKFTNNKITIPNNGIVLTSSKTNTYKLRYHFSKPVMYERFNTSYFEECNCYGKANHKFMYLEGSLNGPESNNSRKQESLLEIICDKLNKGKIKSDLESGYNGRPFTEQTEITINDQNLTSFPKGLLELKNLTSINIHSNDLRTIPDEVYQFPKLKRLIIGFNNIEELPDKIGRLITLEDLAVNGNELIDLPDTLLTLPNLKSLSIQENKFTKEKKVELMKKYKKKGIKLQFH